MPNTASILGLLERLESDAIAVHQNRCAVVRNKNAQCRKCADACTSGCISVREDELVLEPERCIGCGSCATVCPTAALEAQNPDDAALLRQCLSAIKGNEGAVVIACNQAISAAPGTCDLTRVVGLVCLGRVEETLLTALAQSGATQVHLVRAQCDACPLEVGLQTAELVCDSVSALLGAWGNALRISLADTFPLCVSQKKEMGPDHDHGESFSEVHDDAQAVATKATDLEANETPEVKAGKEGGKSKEGVQSRQGEGPHYVKVMKDGTLPHFIPERRKRLLKTLAAMGTPRGSMVTTRLWGRVVIDTSSCTSCQMCATFCPTGAIKKFTDPEGAFGVEHAPRDCVKCRCCVDICREGALRLSDEVSVDAVLRGLTERYDMKPRKNPPNSPHSILHSLEGLIGANKVYER